MPKQTFSDNEAEGDSASQKFGNSEGPGPVRDQTFTANKAKGKNSSQSFGNSGPEQRDTRGSRSNHPE